MTKLQILTDTTKFFTIKVHYLILITTFAMCKYRLTINLY